MGNGCTSAKAVQTSTTANVPISNLKIVVVGETLSGKTSVVKRFEKNFYQDCYEPTKTLNIVSIVKKVNIPNHKIITVELWDVPAHGDLDMNKSYFQNAHAAIVVADLSDEDSYYYALQWKRNIYRHHSSVSLRSSELSLSQRNSDSLPVLLLGNKFDLVKQALLRNQLHSGSVSHSSNGRLTRYRERMSVQSDKNLFDFNPEQQPRLGEDHGDIMRDNLLAHQHVETPHETANFDQNDRVIDADLNHEISSVEHKTDHEKSSGNREENCLIDSDQTNSGNITNHHANQEMSSANHKPERERSPVNNKEEHQNGEGPQHQSTNDEKDGEKSRNQERDPENSTNHEKDEKNSTNHEQDTEKLTNHEKDADKSTKHETETTGGKENPQLRDLREALDKKSEAEIKSKRQSVTSETAPLSGEDGKSRDVRDGDHPVESEVHDPDTEAENADVEENGLEMMQSGLPAADGDNKTSERRKSKLKKLFPKDLQDENEKLIDQISLESPSSPSIDVSLLAPSVEKLEAFAEQNGFLAGIPVSAKESKGGVHEAIQSLLRHLLNKAAFHPDRKRRNDDVLGGRKRIWKNARIAEEFETLQEVGIIEIDEVLKLCNSPLQTAESITSAFREAMREFKRACHGAGLVTERRVTVEECIAALKEAVESSQHATTGKSDVRMALLLRDQPKYSLAATDKSGFIWLYVVDADMNEVEVESSIPDNIASILQLYHEKIHSTCCWVLEKSAELQQQLEHHLDVMGDKEEKAWDLAVAAGRSQVEVRRILTVLAQARARMRGTLELLRDTRKAVGNLQAKTRAVLLF